MEDRRLPGIPRQAELVVPGQDEPARWPAAAIVAEIGFARADLPGKRLVATLRETREDRRVFSGFRVV
ncbi:MAG TPA: hypothetical protein VMU94_00510 [Streptosporangiaceae bacterium]|nr:hypothetical protein [Streptosporangiaceae bacterium]